MSILHRRRIVCEGHQAEPVPDTDTDTDPATPEPDPATPEPDAPAATPAPGMVQRFFNGG